MDGSPASHGAKLRPEGDERTQFPARNAITGAAVLRRQYKRLGQKSAKTEQMWACERRGCDGNDGGQNHRWCVVGATNHTNATTIFRGARSTATEMSCFSR